MGFMITFAGRDKFHLVPNLFIKNGDAVERVPPSLEAFREGLEKKILANLKPEELGLRFEPVREQALKAAEQSQDFGGLFLGFSFFLIVAALLLMAMLFQFGLEQRTPEIGTLLALGFTPKQVRKLLLREGVALAFTGDVARADDDLARGGRPVGAEFSRDPADAGHRLVR